MSFFTSGIIPSGVVLPYAGATAPNGWLLCFGQAVPRTTYSGLFAAIGTTYGVGDGTTTFGLPDLRGRSVFGKDDMGGVAASRVTNAVSGIVGTTLGATGGTELLHSHGHTAGTFATVAIDSFTQSANHTHTFTTGTMNSNTAHTHLQNDYTVGGGGPVIGTRGDIYAAGVLSNTNTPTQSTNIDHTHSGITAGMSANHTHNVPSTTLTGTSATNGTGNSQNMTPTIILNQIIKV